MILAKSGISLHYISKRSIRKKGPKEKGRYSGPYLLLRVLSPAQVIIQLSVRSQPFVASIDRLKRCDGDHPQSWWSPVSETIGPSEDDEHSLVIRHGLVDSLSAKDANVDESRQWGTRKSKATINVQGSSCIEAGVERLRLSPEPMVGLSHGECGKE